MSAELNMEPAPELAAEIAQPAAARTPLPQSFKCEKCGAAFDDEGSAAAHIQTCKGSEAVLVEPKPS